MASDDVYPYEMKRHGFDDSTIDQLLAGSTAPGQELIGLVAFVEEVRRTYLSHPPQVGPALASLLVEGLVPSDKGDLPVRTASNATGPASQAAGLPKRRARKMIGAVLTTLAGKIALAGAATAATVGSLGAAGALPGPMQSFVAEKVSAVGVQFPDPHAAGVARVAAAGEFKVEALLAEVDHSLTDLTVPEGADVSLADPAMSADVSAAQQARIKERCDRAMAHVDEQYAKQSAQVDNEKASANLDEHYREARSKVDEHCSEALAKVEAKLAKAGEGVSSDVADDPDNLIDDEPGHKSDVEETDKDKANKDDSDTDEVEQKARENEKEGRGAKSDDEPDSDASVPSDSSSSPTTSDVDSDSSDSSDSTGSSDSSDSDSSGSGSSGSGSGSRN